MDRVSQTKVWAVASTGLLVASGTDAGSVFGAEWLGFLVKGQFTHKITQRHQREARYMKQH